MTEKTEILALADKIDRSLSLNIFFEEARGFSNEKIGAELKAEIVSVIRAAASREDRTK